MRGGMAQERMRGDGRIPAHQWRSRSVAITAVSWLQPNDAGPDQLVHRAAFCSVASLQSRDPIAAAAAATPARTLDDAPQLHDVPRPPATPNRDGAETLPRILAFAAPMTQRLGEHASNRNTPQPTNTTKHTATTRRRGRGRQSQPRRTTNTAGHPSFAGRHASSSPHPNSE